MAPSGLLLQCRAAKHAAEAMAGHVWNRQPQEIMARPDRFDNVKSG